MRKFKLFHISYLLIIFAILASTLLGSFCLIAIKHPGIVGMIRAVLGGGGNSPVITPTTPEGGGGEDYTIDSLSELKSFAQNVKSGKTYNGITLKLGANIDCGGAGIGIGGADSAAGTVGSIAVAMGCFEGTFDGQGYTISNFAPTDRAKSYIEPDNYAYALFPYVMAATIKNLRVYGVSRSISGGDYKAVGGIVGYAAADTLIENCIVENMSIATTDRRNRIYVGGIFAVGAATVKNCYVKDVWVDQCGTLAGIGCVHNDNGTWLGDPSTVTGCVVRNVETGSGTKYEYLGDNLDGTDYAHQMSGNYITKDLTYENLRHSAIGGANSLYPWYFYSGYNAGWPMLRTFMSWQTLQFRCVGGTVSPTSIKIPSGETPAYDAKSPSINVMGQTVTAVPTSGTLCHIGANWTVSGLTHTCTFSAPTYSISFYAADNTKMIVNSVEKNTTQTFSISCGTNLKFSIVDYSKGNGALKSATFTFDDINGTTQTVKYEISNYLYCISNILAYKIDGPSTTTFILSPQNALHKDASITVETSKKSYDLIIQ